GNPASSPQRPSSPRPRPIRRGRVSGCAGTERRPDRQGRHRLRRQSGRGHTLADGHHPRAAGLGIGTHLISAAENRIRQRGLAVAQLDVEVDNPRARTLYERLGYREAGRRSGSWAAEDADGTTSLYETEVATLRKDLG